MECNEDWSLDTGLTEEVWDYRPKKDEGIWPQSADEIKILQLRGIGSCSLPFIYSAPYQTCQATRGNRSLHETHVMDDLSRNKKSKGAGKQPKHFLEHKVQCSASGFPRQY